MFFWNSLAFSMIQKRIWRKRMEISRNWATAHFLTFMDLELSWHLWVYHLACYNKQCRRPGLDPWVGKIPWRREWQSTPVFLLGESYGQRSLAGHSLWSCKELDTTEQLTLLLLQLWQSWLHQPLHLQGSVPSFVVRSITGF